MIRRSWEVLQQEGLGAFLRAGVREVLERMGMSPNKLTIQKALAELDEPLKAAPRGEALLLTGRKGAYSGQETEMWKQVLEPQGWRVSELEVGTESAMRWALAEWQREVPGAVLGVVLDEEWLPALAKTSPAAGWQFFLSKDLSALEEAPGWLRTLPADMSGHWDAFLAGCFPLTSLLIVTYNNLDATRLCLRTILENTVYPYYELILVDNGSQDGTPEALLAFARQHGQRAPMRVILNEENRGFSAANNQAIEAAQGDTLVFLNNDILTPPGWLVSLRAHLEDPKTGMVGPRTNYWGNESRLEVRYRSLRELYALAMRRQQQFSGQAFEIPMLALYCVAMRAEVAREIGPLDERFGVGMFEDDDYSHRVHQAGYRILCAQDVFIHHWGKLSFSKLDKERYERLFAENQRKFEEKWGIPWQAPRQEK